MAGLSSHSLVAIAVATICATTPIAAQSATTQPPAAGRPAPIATGTIEGRVRAERAGVPISGATVELLGDASGPARPTSAEARGTRRSAITDAEGRFTLANLVPGIYALTISAIGFEPAAQADVAVGTGRPAQVTIVLRERPLQLAELTTEAPTFFRPPAEFQVSAQVLGQEEIRRAPGVQEDVVRAISLFPGVGVTTGGRNDLVVRGGAPFENLFLIDGIEIANLNHFGSQGSTGGPLALLTTDVIQQAQFSAGGFDARYGDKVSSVTSLTLREGNETRMAGKANFSATGLNALVEGPLGRGNFWFGLRRSYFDLVFKAVGFSFIPTFWDAEFKVVQRLDARNSVSLLGVGALDDLSFNNDTPENRYKNREVQATEQRQYLTGLTWTHQGDRSRFSLTASRTFTRFRTFQNDTLLTRIFQNFSSEGENALRADLLASLGGRLDLNIGATGRVADPLAYSVLLPGTLRRDAAGTPRPLATDTTFTAARAGAYGSLQWAATNALHLTLGVRGDWYGYLGDATRLSPRLGLSWDVAPSTTLTASAGRYYQPPSYIWFAGDPANRSLLPFRVDQAVVGVQRLLRPDLKLQLEVYGKRYADYPARLFRPQAVLSPTGFEDVTADIPFGLEPLTSVGEGRAIGAELFVQKKLGLTPWYGLASISLNSTEFRGLDGIWRRGAFDVPVIATVLAGWRPNARWELSGKFRVSAGRPNTPYILTGPTAGQLDYSQYNSGDRLPIFHALDVRVDRRWSARGRQFVAYVDIQNFYGRQNVSNYRWNPRLGVGEPDESLGIFPTIGVTVEF